METIKHGSSRKAKPFKGSGKKGESLFHNFFIEAVAKEKEVELINKNYTRHLSYIRRAKDDRLLAIVGALAIEEALDSLLRAYIPKYKILQDKRLNIPMKIDLVHSLKLIPAHLLGAVAVIGKIRNEFAHELDKDDFNSVSVKMKDKLIKIFKELHPENNINSYSISMMFSTTISGILASFGAYASNLKLAKEYIYSDDFLLKIQEIVKGNSK